MNLVTCLRSTSISRHSNKFSQNNYLVPGVCAPLLGISRHSNKFSQNNCLVPGVCAPLLDCNAENSIKRQRGIIGPKKEAERLKEE